MRRLSFDNDEQHQVQRSCYGASPLSVAYYSFYVQRLSIKIRELFFGPYLLLARLYT